MYCIHFFLPAISDWFLIFDFWYQFYAIISINFMTLDMYSKQKNSIWLVKFHIPILLKSFISEIQVSLKYFHWCTLCTKSFFFSRIMKILSEGSEDEAVSFLFLSISIHLSISHDKMKLSVCMYSNKKCNPLKVSPPLCLVPRVVQINEIIIQIRLRLIG